MRILCVLAVCSATAGYGLGGDGVHLRSGSVFAAESTAEGRPGALRIVKFGGPPSAAQLASLRAIGEVYTYLPDHAFLVRLDVETEALAATGVSWSRPFEAWMAVSPEVRAAQPNSTNLRPLMVHLTPDADLVAAEAAIVEIVGRPVEARANRSRFGRVRVLVSDAELVGVRERLAEVPGVFWLEREARKSFSNSDGVWLGQAGIGGSGATPLFDRGLLGTGQIVGVLDTGVDIDSCYFWDAANGLPATNPCDGGIQVDLDQRKVVAVDFLWANECAGGISNTEWDTQGHGTHVAGTVAGDDFAVPGAHNGQDGMAPGAKLVVQDCGFQTDNCADCPGLSCAVIDLNPVFQQAYDQGARIHTNSWGDEENDPNYGQYTAGSQDADEFMWNHKDFLLLFAAGNNGGTTNTVDSPSTAKSVVSVGSTQHGSSAGSISSFSSRGPTDDGRIKPDVTFQGSSVISAANNGNITNFNCTTTSNSGTSMATPGVAGLAALVRQYFVDGFYPSGIATPADTMVPSAALIKAVLINSAESMSNAGAIPNATQGWGRVTLDRALYLDGDQRRLWVEDDQTGFVSAGQSTSYTLAVDGGEALELTLTWTDFPSTPAASTNLVNDLDLEITGPDGTFRGNVFAGGVSTTGGGFDRLNSVETILIPSPTAGTWTVTVTAFTIPQGPQPFALVASGRLNPCGGAATASAVSGTGVFTPTGGDADGYLDNCESGQLEFVVANLGLSAATNARVVAVSSPSHPAIQFASPSWTAASLPGCSTATAFVDVDAAGGLAPGDTVTIEVELTHDEVAPVVATASFEVPNAETDDMVVASRAFDFESELEGWTVGSGVFGRASTVSPPSGSWYLQSSANLANQCDVVRSPPMVLSPTSTLELDTAYQIEGGTPWWDRANVRVVDGGLTTVVAPTGGRLYNVPNGSANGTCGMANQAGWAGSSPTWAASTFNAAALGSVGLAGRPIQLEVRYGTDTSVHPDGFRFDRVTVTDIVETGPDQQPDCSTEIFSDGFEAGNSVAWSATVP